MFFLGTKNRSNNNKIIKPSPTNTKVNSDQKSRKYQNIPNPFPRRTSFFASFSLGRLVSAGMTVEATMALPLFLFFFLHLMGCVEMIRLHGKLTFALWDTGKKLMVYGAVAEAAEVDLPDIGVSYLYVENCLVQLLGKDYLDESPLVYGRKGLNYLASEYNEEEVDIALSYEVRPKISIFPFTYSRMGNRFLGKTWSGYDVEGKEEKYVYVTLYGEVWHSTPDCTHIFIDIKLASRKNIEGLQNNVGAYYRPCELCEEEKWTDVVYYTPQGDCFHKVKNCSALIRYVRAMEWSPNIPYRACSRCGKESVQ